MCIAQNCKKQASYGYENEKKRLYCNDCKKEGMVYIKSYVCNYPNCNIAPTYGYKGSKKALFCGSHRELSMVDVKNKVCEFQNCTVLANFGFESDKHPKFCKTHIEQGMISLKKSQNCKFNNCRIHAFFGNKGDDSPSFCVSHKTPQMINIRTKKCQFHGGCDKIPIYGIKNTKTAYLCSSHREIGMVDVRHKICEYNGCETIAHYGSEKDRIAKFCSKHKGDGINIREKKCSYWKCNLIPTFGLENTKIPILCEKHKTDDLVDLTLGQCQYRGCKRKAVFGLGDKNTFCGIHKSDLMIRYNSCHFIGCTISPSYNFEGLSKPIYCLDHKMCGMINVVSKICEADNCKTHAGFGLLFKPKTRCKKHSTSNMFAENRPTCKQCKEPAYYAIKGINYPTLCENHATKEHINLIEKPCKKCGLELMLGDLGICNYCLDYEQKIHHKKENDLKKFFDSNNLVYESHDKIIDTLCNYKRPDFVFDYPLFKIIVEVDENQHKTYPCECEQTRMIMIHQSFGGTPVIFIRFNPDNYEVNKDQKKVLLKTRKTMLLKLLNEYKNVKEWNIPLSVIYMFYDNYDNKNEIEEIKY